MTLRRAAKWTVGIIVLLATIYLLFPYIAASLDSNRNNVSELTAQNRTFNIDGRSVVAEVAIAPSSGMPSGAFGNGIFKQRKVRLDQVAGFELLPDFVLFEGVDPAETRDISVKVSLNDQKDLAKILHKVIEEAYGVQISSVKKTRKVYVVKQRAAEKPLLLETREGNGAYFIKPSVADFKANGITIDQMIKALSHVLQVAIIDETGLKQKYNINFTFSDSSPSNVMKDFAAQAGLNVKLEERSVDVLLVRPRDSQNSHS